MATDEILTGATFEQLIPKAYALRREFYQQGKHLCADAVPPSIRMNECTITMLVTDAPYDRLMAYSDGVFNRFQPNTPLLGKVCGVDVQVDNTLPDGEIRLRQGYLQSEVQPMAAEGVPSHIMAEAKRLADQNDDTVTIIRDKRTGQYGYTRVLRNDAKLADFVRANFDAVEEVLSEQEEARRLRRWTENADSLPWIPKTPEQILGLAAAAGSPDETVGAPS